MYYSEIKRHIIDKKYYWSYCIIIIISLVFGSLACINKVDFSFFYSRGAIFTLLIFGLSILAIGCIWINLHRCRSFYKFYNIFLKGHNAQFNKIVIEKEDYKMQVSNNSYNATIRPAPKTTNVVYLETDDLLLLFFSIQYMGIFQRILKPFIFIKTDKDFFIKDKNINIIRNFEIVETEQSRTIIFSNKYGIKKVIIQDYLDN